MTSNDTRSGDTSRPAAGRVAGKVAIITGAASGLGKADALRLAEEGARLVLTDIDTDAGRVFAEHLRGVVLFHIKHSIFHAQCV